jgi:hypothetical protein
MDGITDAEFEDLYNQSAKADPVYNLVEDATEECLAGDCEHFCGEPTEDDKDRFYARGWGHLVEAYENHIHYV